ncbi:hypothetical protein PAMP_008515 [Pampus punctatissimus]
METVMERECSALGGLFQSVIGDMKIDRLGSFSDFGTSAKWVTLSFVLFFCEAVCWLSDGSYPVWDDFVSKASKLQSQLRTTVVAVAAFLDAFQKVADLATNSRAALVPRPTSTSVRVEWLLRECDG